MMCASCSMFLRCAAHESDASRRPDVPSFWPPATAISALALTQSCLLRASISRSKLTLNWFAPIERAVSGSVVSGACCMPSRIRSSREQRKLSFWYWNSNSSRKRLIRSTWSESSGGNSKWRLSGAPRLVSMLRCNSTFGKMRPTFSRRPARLKASTFS
jgi:hypothetical protein